jgi:F5/8 type C domain
MAPYRSLLMRKAIAAVFLAALAACSLSPVQLLAGILVSQDLGVSAYSASTYWQATTAPQYAFDGNVNDDWNAGTFPTQWVEVDLQQRYDLTSFSLFVDQLPDGNTTHEVWVSNSVIQNDLRGPDKTFVLENAVVARDAKADYGRGQCVPSILNEFQPVITHAHSS